MFSWYSRGFVLVAGGRKGVDDQPVLDRSPYTTCLSPLKRKWLAESTSIQRSILRTALACVAVIAGCMTKYEPHLVLLPSPFDHAIDAGVEVHPLLATDQLRSGHLPYGVVVEGYVNRSLSKLTKVITSEILNEFSSNGVFRRISSFDPDPDLLLTGRIEQFYEHDRRKLWTYVPLYADKLAGLFRLNTHLRTGEVQVTMILLEPSGGRVGTYTGHVKFDEDFTPNDEIRPGDRLNRAFGEALTQIHEQILADVTLPKARRPASITQYAPSDGNR